MWVNKSLFDLLKPKIQVLTKLGATNSNSVDQLSKQMKSTTNDNAKKMILNKIMNMNKEELIEFLKENFKKFSITIIFVLVVAYLLSFESYMANFLTKYNSETSSDWQYEYKEIFASQKSGILPAQQKGHPKRGPRCHQLRIQRPDGRHRPRGRAIHRRIRFAR